MKAGDVLKHKNNTDVAIQILRAFYIAEKRYYKLRVSWLNVVSTPYSMGVLSTIFLPLDKVKDWEFQAY